MPNGPQGDQPPVTKNRGLLSSRLSNNRFQRDIFDFKIVYHINNFNVLFSFSRSLQYFLFNRGVRFTSCVFDKIYDIDGFLWVEKVLRKIFYNLQ